MTNKDDLLYHALLKQVNESPGSWAEAGKEALAHLENLKIKRTVKIRLARAVGHLQQVEYWLMNNGTSDEISDFMNLWSPGEEVLIHLARTREDLDWKILEEILSNNQRIGWMLRAEFIRSLNLTLISKYMVEILAIRDLSLHFYVRLLNYAREKYQISEDVPDEWVERLLIGDPQTAKERLIPNSGISSV